MEETAMTKKKTQADSRRDRFVSNSDEYVVVRPKDQAKPAKGSGRLAKGDATKSDPHGQ